MALFIVFVIALVLGYIIIWSPFVSRLSRDVNLPLLTSIDPPHEAHVVYHTDTHNNEDPEDTRIPE